MWWGIEGVFLALFGLRMRSPSTLRREHKTLLIQFTSPTVVSERVPGLALARDGLREMPLWAPAIALNTSTPMYLHPGPWWNHGDAFEEGQLELIAARIRAAIDERRGGPRVADADVGGPRTPRIVGDAPMPGLAVPLMGARIAIGL
jgi:hypothetical protein